MHSHLPNFGFEEGYYNWVGDPVSETKEDARKRTLLRNRNHLSIRFYEEYGEAFHDSVLEAYNIEPVWPQTFGKQVPMPGFYRVIDKPADEYYTTYGDTALNRLGNLPEVEYVFPTFYKNEQFCDLRLTPVILFGFEDHIIEQRQQEILDSLITEDRIELHQLFPGEEWSDFNIYVTKGSWTDPYTLHNHYYNLPFFKFAEPDFVYTTRFLNHPDK